MIRTALVSVALALGHARARRCAPGEVWQPTEWLAEDLQTVKDAAASLGIELTDELLLACWEAYRDP